MVDFAKIDAIDFHTHAEEPCNDSRDDGYNEFQAGMADYFKNPAGARGILPTVQDTANCYRERNIAAVIFPVDAERETGFRRYSNEESVARDLIEFDKHWVARFSETTRGTQGANKRALDVKEFQHYFAEHGRYNAGVAV